MAILMFWSAKFGGAVAPSPGGFSTGEVIMGFVTSVSTLSVAADTMNTTGTRSDGDDFTWRTGGAAASPHSFGSTGGSCLLSNIADRFPGPAGFTCTFVDRVHGR